MHTLKVVTGGERQNTTYLIARFSCRAILPLIPELMLSSVGCDNYRVNPVHPVESLRIELSLSFSFMRVSTGTFCFDNGKWFAVSTPENIIGFSGAKRTVFTNGDIRYGNLSQIFSRGIPTCEFKLNINESSASVSFVVVANILGRSLGEGGLELSFEIGLIVLEELYFLLPLAASCA